MSHYPKTALLIKDENNGVFEKLWIVGEPSARVLNYIGESATFDPTHRNEERTSRCYSSPKYFGTYAEARACAKFWNEKIDDPYHPNMKLQRHGMRCNFKPHLVKVTLA